MALKLPYDETDKYAIEAYSKGLIGKTFADVLSDYYKGNSVLEEESAEYYSNPRGKGSLGNLIEKYYFMYEPNSDSAPDFPEAGVELKVTPYEKLKSKDRYKAGERLVIGMIPNDQEIGLDFEASHVLEKLRWILLILYLRDKEQVRTDYQIDYATLFSITSEKFREDYLIIESDYRKIVEKIRAGKAHELSEGDTVYLGACTKGATAKRSLQPQFYNETVPAKRRAFSLKQGYMSQLINDYIIEDIPPYDVIVKDIEVLEHQDFESIVIERLNHYIGQQDVELSEKFDVTFKNKSAHSRLAFSMLGVSSNNAEEFVKANIVVKAIRIEENNTIRESMSFPAMNFTEFANEEWEDSEIYNYFSETKFLFVVFKKSGEHYTFQGAQFWNMPTTELETTGKEEWLACQNVIKNGVDFVIGKNRVENNLPKAKETKMFHMRPHAKLSVYLINGVVHGSGILERDADILPNGDMMTKQSFWLNNTYIASIINHRKNES